jgi:hypothetical protein
VEPALGIRRCPLVQLALEVKYPLLRHIELRERRACVHGRPPSIQPCCVLTGPLRHVPGFAGSDYYGSSATSRRQQWTVRLPKPKGSAGTAGTLPTFTIDRSAGSAPSSTPEPSPRGTRTEYLSSPQPPVSGLMRCIGASTTGSLTTPFCLATAPGPLAADRCSIVRGCSRPPSHLGHQTARQLHPTVKAAGGGSFHPTRSYGTSWRTPPRQRQGSGACRLLANARARSGGPRALQLAPERGEEQAS